MLGWALALIGISGATLIALRDKSAPDAVPNSIVAVITEDAAPYQTELFAAAEEGEIPLPILMAWIYRESTFRPRHYNPELGVMQRWACDVAGNPGKWSSNPDYQQAVSVCNQLRNGADPAALRSAWTFGSIGMLQVSRIPASEVGGMPYSMDNSRLYNLAFNLRVGIRYINSLKRRWYPNKKLLTIAEWRNVRASYVMGFQGARRRPERAREISQRWYDALVQFMLPEDQARYMRRTEG